MSDLRKVVVVNTSDIGGGAERVAMSVLDGFEQLGTETWMVVGQKVGSHSRVLSVYESPHVDYRRFSSGVQRARWSLRRRLEWSAGLESFSHPYTRMLPDMAGPRPDVLFCNNLHGGFFDLRQLPRISGEVTTVLRLADSWTFTGHCAVPRGCERWQLGCGDCPDLTIPPEIGRDATRRNWKRKRKIFSRSRLFVVAPSRWMLERARRSILAPAIVDAAVIPNGVDLDNFRPDGPREAGRNSLPRLLFVANNGSANRFKDFSTLRDALGLLKAPVELVAVGRAGQAESIGGSRIRHLPRQEPDSLAALYRSADVYVHSAPEETFSLTTAEALACGTPAVAAAVGGISEVVDDGRNGLLVDPGDPGGLAAALERILSDHAGRRRMGAAAAALARDRFDRSRMVSELHAFCRLALERNDRNGASGSPKAGGRE